MSLIVCFRVCWNNPAAGLVVWVEQGDLVHLTEYIKPTVAILPSIEAGKSVC